MTTVKRIFVWGWHAVVGSFMGIGGALVLGIGDPARVIGAMIVGSFVWCCWIDLRRRRRG